MPAPRLTQSKSKSKSFALGIRSLAAPCAMADLPDDILAELILGRLSPRDQASSRCVCKAWRGVIDARGLLRADLLPLTLRGIFLMDSDYDFPPLFSRPAAGPAICDDDLDDFIAANKDRNLDFYGHCNGLLLFWRLVLNPATGRWARFPPPPPPRLPLLGDYMGDYEAILAFDPTLSPYYEVLLIPKVTTSQPALNPESEWPPSPLVLNVFSSRTEQWHERLFEREIHGLHTMGTVAGIREHKECCVVYWRNLYSTFYGGRLYVQCQNGFVMRINLSSGSYHLFKRPMGIDVEKNTQYYLGKSKDGVYYAAVDCECRLQVWCLDESHSQLEWVLKCDIGLMSVMPPRMTYNRDGPWFRHCYGDNNDTQLIEEEIAAKDELEWSSDIEDISSEDGPRCTYEYVAFLGFHPYKEVVFLHQSNRRGIPYHLHCSKIQDLGSLNYLWSGRWIDKSFPYTPCWTGNL